MIEASIARRYARALLSVATEEGRFEDVGEELSSAAAALRSSPELSDVLFNPRYGPAQRQRVLDQLAPRLHLSATVANFLALLSARRRLNALEAIATKYREFADERAGRVRARVTSAVPLADAEVRDITGALERVTLKSVVVETDTDPSLLGGVVAQVGSFVFDGSLKNELERFRAQLKRGV